MVRSFLQSLFLDLPEHRIELDRAHRALQAPRPDGLPRDIIVKLHYYAVKEMVLKASRDSENLVVLGHKMQVFADISPSTMQKRWALKSLFQVLS